jgi:hypothetical protein
MEPDAWAILMRMLPKVFLIALAAVFVAGGIDTADAARKKQRTVRERPAASEQQQRKRDFNRDLGIRLDADGTPIIMQGYGSHSKGGRTTAPEADLNLRADRPRPRGSSGAYVPPVNPSPNAGPTPQQILNRQTVQPYKPPPINTFSDRVTNCIHSYPLNAGIGNNPRDQQAYIRQCAN